MKTTKRKILTQEFFERSALVVARELLGKTLVRRIGKKELRGTIIETEAYIGPRDLAAHSSKGRTPRTEVMFGPAGYWYIFFTYGVHWMANVVTGKKGLAAAVLVRGTDTVSGPARLTKMFAIDKRFNGKKLSEETGLWIEEGISPSPRSIVRTARIGVEYAGPLWAPKLYRFLFDETATNGKPSNSLDKKRGRIMLSRMVTRSVKTAKKSKKRSGGG